MESAEVFSARDPVSKRAQVEQALNGESEV